MYPRYALLLKSHRGQRGLTLLETILAIGAGLVFAISAVVLAVQLFGQNKTQDAFQQIHSMISNIKQVYTSQSSYNGLDAAQIIAGNLTDARYIRGAAVINPWAGAVTFDSAGANDENFEITYAGVPRDACIKLAALNSTGFGGSIVSAEVNGNGATDNMNPAQAATDCDQDTANTIIYVVR